MTKRKFNEAIAYSRKLHAQLWLYANEADGLQKKLSKQQQLLKVLPKKTKADRLNIGKKVREYERFERKAKTRLIRLAYLSKRDSEESKRLAVACFMATMCDQ